MQIRRVVATISPSSIKELVGEKRKTLYRTSESKKKKIKTKKILWCGSTAIEKYLSLRPLTCVSIPWLLSGSLPSSGPSAFFHLFSPSLFHSVKIIPHPVCLLSWGSPVTHVLSLPPPPLIFPPPHLYHSLPSSFSPLPFNIPHWALLFELSAFFTTSHAVKLTSSETLQTDAIKLNSQSVILASWNPVLFVP